MPVTTEHGEDNAGPEHWMQQVHLVEAVCQRVSSTHLLVLASRVSTTWHTAARYCLWPREHEYSRGSSNSTAPSALGTSGGLWSAPLRSPWAGGRAPQPASPPRVQIACATRVHQKPGGPKPDVNAVVRFAVHAAALQRVTQVLIAVSADEHCAGLPDEVQRALDGAWAPPHVVLVRVAPWGAFTPALNALHSAASERRCSHILYASVEITLQDRALDALVAHSDANTSVVGLRLPGHSFHPGRAVPLSGVTVPWNTCALWNLSLLSKCGFLSVSDGGEGGAEEVVVVALLQWAVSASKQHPGTQPAAKLLDVDGVEWDTTFGDPVRAQQQAAKMASKERRAAEQMTQLGLEGAAHMVRHIRIPHVPEQPLW